MNNCENEVYKEKKLNILLIYFETKNALHMKYIICGNIFYRNHPSYQIFNNFHNINNYYYFNIINYIILLI